MKTTISAETRTLIVSQLAQALAAAWRRNQAEKDERPVRLALATGRDVRGDEDREHDALYHTR